MKFITLVATLLAVALAETSSEDLSKSTDDGRETKLDEEKRCSDIIGMYVNNAFMGLNVTYDGAKILEKYGGPAGKLNATRTEKPDAPVKEEDREKRPLPDAGKNYWIYHCGLTDGMTYVRAEHAVHRFSGTPNAFLEIRGQIIFPPEDFCGKARRAVYSLDDRGFTFSVDRGYCWIDSRAVGCRQPPECAADQQGNPVNCVDSPRAEFYDQIYGGGCK